MADDFDKFPDAPDPQSNFDAWSKFRDAAPLKPTRDRSGNPLIDAPLQTAVGLNKGANELLAIPGNLMAWGAEKIGVPHEYADKLRWKDNAVSNFLEAGPAPTTTAGRYAESFGRALPSMMAAEVALLNMAGRAATTAPSISNMLTAPWRESAGAALATDVASTAGATSAVQAAQDSNASPFWQAMAGIGGAIAPSAALSAVNAITTPVRRAVANTGRNGAYGTVAKGITDIDPAVNGLDEFANQVAVGATGQNLQTNRRTLDILGEEMVRANGDVGVAQGSTIARLVAEQGITPQTAARRISSITEVHDGSPLFLGEYPAVAQSDIAQRTRQPGTIDLDELGRLRNTQTQADIDYLSNNGNSQSAMNTRNAVMDRQETLDPTMRQVLGDIGPQVPVGPNQSRPATIADAAQMQDDARRLGSQTYNQAYAAPTNNRILMHWLPRILDHYVNNIAAGRAGEYADAMRAAARQFYITTGNGQQLAMMTLPQLQDARAAVRGMMDGYSRQGRNDIARTLRPLYDGVTTIMERANPTWGQANQQWADLNFLRIGQELGDALTSKASPLYREQINEFRNLAPQAQDIVRIHALQRMYDKLDNLGDTHSISKLWANDASRNMIRDLFGDDAVVQFSRAIRDQKVAEMSKNALGNSATHRRGMAQRQRDAETNLASAVELANPQAARNWLLERASQILTEHKNRPMAEILTTPISDTAQVAGHLHRMRQQQARLNAIRRRNVAYPVSGLASVPAAMEDNQ